MMRRTSGRLGRSGRRPATAAAAISLASLCAPSGAHGQGFGYFGEHGSLWAEARTAGSPQAAEQTDPLAEVRIRQSFDVIRFSRGLYAGAFGEIGAKRDIDHLDFDNKLTAGLGIQVRRDLTGWGSVALGLKYQREWRPISERALNTPIGFLDWGLWHQWSPGSATAPAFPRPRRYVFSSWGELRYPSSGDDAERHDALIEGAVKGSIDWLRLGKNVRIGTFAALGFKADSVGLGYNNQIEPNFGVRLGYRVRPNVRLALGAKFVVDYRFLSGSTVAGPALFAGLISSW